MTVQTGTCLGSFDGTSYNADAKSRQEESIDSLGTPAQGNFSFGANPADGSTITINGTVVTFVAATPSAGQVLIADTAAHTIVALLAVVQASADAQLVKFSYSIDATHLYLVSVVPGTAANAYTLAAESSPADSHATRSAATMLGGLTDTLWATRVAAQYGTASALPGTGSTNA
jgi:hypothetical protein